MTPWLLALMLFGGGSPERLPAQTTGTVEGTVAVVTRPARRSVGRYPGASTTAHAIQQVPAVAYVVGPVSGVPSPVPATPPTMTQRDTAFVPPVLVVPVGTTVRFPNDDAFFHNVFSYSASARFDLGRYPKGEAKEVTFDKPGIVKVYCEVHEFMRSAIIVTENPFHAVVDSEGRFRLEGLPDGAYTLAVWHPDLGSVEEQVRVRAGSVTRVSLELR